MKTPSTSTGYDYTNAQMSHERVPLLPVEQKKTASPAIPEPKRPSTTTSAAITKTGIAALPQSPATTSASPSLSHRPAQALGWQAASSVPTPIRRTEHSAPLSYPSSMPAGQPASPIYSSQPTQIPTGAYYSPATTSFMPPATVQTPIPTPQPSSYDSNRYPYGYQQTPASSMTPTPTYTHAPAPPHSPLCGAPAPIGSALSTPSSYPDSSYRQPYAASHTPSHQTVTPTQSSLARLPSKSKPAAAASTTSTSNSEANQSQESPLTTPVSTSSSRRRSLQQRVKKQASAPDTTTAEKNNSQPTPKAPDDGIKTDSTDPKKPPSPIQLPPSTSKPLQQPIAVSPAVVVSSEKPKNAYHTFSSCCNCSLLAALIAVVAGLVLTAYSRDSAPNFSA